MLRTKSASTTLTFILLKFTQQLALGANNTVGYELRET